MFRSIKAKLNNKERLEQACSTAVSALQTTLRIAQEAAAMAAVPGLKAGVAGLLLVLDVIKKTSQNVEDVKGLSKQVEELNLVLEKSKNEGTLSPVAIERIDRLFTTSNAAVEKLQQMASRHAIKRFIHSEDDAQLISGHIQTMMSSMQTFTVETMLAIESAVDEHAVKIREDIGNLHNTTTSGLQELKALNRTDTKAVRPPYAKSSPFDSKDRSGCLEGTRTDILDRIYHWIGISDSQLQGAASKGKSKEANPISQETCIFWINGGAGTGKTTIAYTVSEVCRRSNLLGASFFCSRDDADCSNPRLIFTSIAYQLGNLSALVRTEVSRVMESNPDIGYSSPSYQLEQLIVNPLRTLGNSFSPCVVVLDALDECKESGSTSAVLSSLSLYANRLFPLKFLVTSRPESHITTVFKSRELDTITWRFVLHEVELGIVQSDIEHYLSTKLALTRTSYELETEWPSAEDIHALTRISFGLFIFASTSVRFVEDRDYCDPKHQLGRLLCNAPTLTEDSSPHYNLDRLYDQVLNNAFPNISSHLSGRLKMIVGAIVLLRDPLSSVAIERLLAVPSRTVRATLQRLHSVIMVPDDETQVIRTLHPSFFDFITNPTRCLNPNHVVDPKTQHTAIARACLSAMKELKRDICGIRNSSLLNTEVDDLPMRVMACIQPELQYACRHWAWHLENATIDNLVDLMNEFCSKYLLYWVEALSLMGDLRNGLLALDTAQQVIAKADRDVTDTMQLLRDCERLTLEFFSIISTCSLQVYHSALLFTPEDTLIKKKYGRELDIPIKVYNGLEEKWNPCIRTIEGHSGWVCSVAFSPDGTRIVSGSSDHTVRLWDAVSGAHLNTFMGHSRRINSVSFSPDGTRIVSGSDDRTIQVWDVVSGAHLNTFMGHSRSVSSVAFSPDGTRIVSGSKDHTVRLWDAVSGAHLNTFSGRSDCILSIAFSLDGTRIVSGSDDQTIQIWDAVSGAHLNTFMGHSYSVNSIAFSPDGTRIVSASHKTVRLWDAVNGAHLITLSGHSDRVSSIAFSPDGKRIVSGSWDKTVRLWDAMNGAHLNTFLGHSDQAFSIAFSPDGTRIVSGSSDKTVRLWDAVSGRHKHTFKTHSDVVNSIAFSPDGTRIVSGSNDETVQLWDAVSGTNLNTFVGHSDWVISVAFSPDVTRIVSGSKMAVRLWDAVSGAHLKTFVGHSSWVRSVTFSLDGTRVVSGSDDHTVRLWDAVSGAHLNTFLGHSDWIQLVAISPDGSRIVSISTDETFRLWDALSGANLKTFRAHSHWVDSVSFSSDGTRIVSQSSNNIVYLSDVASGTHQKILEGCLVDVESFARSCCLSGNSLSANGLNPTSPVFTTDHWVHSLTLDRRICWVPVSLRPTSFAANGARTAFGTGDGRVVILDFTGMDTYFRNL